MRRIDLMQRIAGLVGDDLVICNQGGNSQDWHEVRPRNNFYLQHAMGSTTAIALGLAMARPDERVWAFEGDGGMLMNLGLLAVMAKARPRNLKVVIFDNENHECGGPYPTFTVATVDLAATALACGWDDARLETDEEGFVEAAGRLASSDDLGLVVAKVEIGTDGAPMTIDAVEGKFRFVRDVERKLGIEIIHAPEHYSTTF
jgi:thiamine pyrophosphate-dependent acetolactate synthase large subunit-like protein